MKEWERKDNIKSVASKSNLLKPENCFCTKMYIHLKKKMVNSKASLFLEANYSPPCPNCLRRRIVESNLKHLKLNTKAIYTPFKRRKQMGQIIISKYSLPREKQIWNPKSNEFEIISKAIKRNKQVQKLHQLPQSTSF